MEDNYTLFKHPDLEKMFDFLEDKLPEKEMLALEAHLLECEACAAALEQMDRAGGPTAENRREAAAFEGVFREKMQVPPRDKPRFGWNAFFRVAAILLLALNIGWASWYLSERSSQEKFAPLAEDSFRSPAETQLKTAQNAYDDGKFEEAVILLQSIPDDPASVEAKLLYLGTALLALDRDEEALAALLRLKSNPEWTVYRAEAQHYFRIACQRLANSPK